jgi:hypothetical protein
MTSLMNGPFRFSCRVWLVTYQGVFVIVRSVLDWLLCILATCDLLSHPWTNEYHLLVISLLWNIVWLGWLVNQQQIVGSKSHIISYHIFLAFLCVSSIRCDYFTSSYVCLHLLFFFDLIKQKTSTNSMAFSPQVNCTDYTELYHWSAKSVPTFADRRVLCG